MSNGIQGLVAALNTKADEAFNARDALPAGNTNRAGLERQGNAYRNASLMAAAVGVLCGATTEMPLPLSESGAMIVFRCNRDRDHGGTVHSGTAPGYDDKMIVTWPIAGTLALPDVTQIPDIHGAVTSVRHEPGMVVLAVTPDGGSLTPAMAERLAAELLRRAATARFEQADLADEDRAAFAELGQEPTP